MFYILDNDVLKTEVNALKRDIEKLKDTVETYDANVEEYKTKIRTLEDKLLCSEKNCISIKEELQIHLISASETEKGNCSFILL